MNVLEFLFPGSFSGDASAAIACNEWKVDPILSHSFVPMRGAFGPNGRWWMRPPDLLTIKRWRKPITLVTECPRTYDNPTCVDFLLEGFVLEGFVLICMIFSKICVYLGLLMSFRTWRKQERRNQRRRGSVGWVGSQYSKTDFRHRGDRGETRQQWTDIVCRLVRTISSFPTSRQRVLQYNRTVQWTMNKYIVTSTGVLSVLV